MVVRWNIYLTTSFYFTLQVASSRPRSYTSVVSLTSRPSPWWGSSVLSGRGQRWVSFDCLPNILVADSRFAPSQWEKALLCNDVSHWLGGNLQSALHSYPSGSRSGAWDMVSNWLASPFFIGWSRYRIELPRVAMHCGLTWLVGISTVLQRPLQSLCTAQRKTNCLRFGLCKETVTKSSVRFMSFLSSSVSTNIIVVIPGSWISNYIRRFKWDVIA